MQADPSRQPEYVLLRDCDCNSLLPPVQADTNLDNRLSLGELRDVLHKASSRFSHLREHAQFLDRKTGGLNRWGGLVSQTLRGERVGGFVWEVT